MSDPAQENSGKNHKSGFVALVGRPNVGKSTLANALCAEKVSIVSSRPQTTRSLIRGVSHSENSQIIFLDTPGIHKPASDFSERLNQHARSAADDADVICFLLDATRPAGKGDEFVLSELLRKQAGGEPVPIVGVVSKCDLREPPMLVEQLAALQKIARAAVTPEAAAGEEGALARDETTPDLSDYIAVSAKTGENLEKLRQIIISHLPVGPKYYPPEIIRDLDWETWIAELVREQLLPMLREELPHSVATKVLRDDNRIVCEIVVERQSQKPIVLGRKAKNLTKIREAITPELPPDTELVLKVKVSKHWQSHPERYNY